ncbi:gliding motility protein RemB [Sungkyunkwania multivorans]|uniref:Gliding motility protein RemB n=1 Tax=Sungkyunkwania multivorans TaxID=1173618 RepID=A0ABW3CUX9_9FLAO
MKKTLLLCAFLVAFATNAQKTYDAYYKYPVFEECQQVTVEELSSCFETTLKTFIFENFEVPSKIAQEDYKGKLVILFEVTSEGAFKVLYVDAVYKELIEESKRVFGLLPTVAPPLYSGRPTYMQFTLPVTIPLTKEMTLSSIGSKEKTNAISKAEVKNEFDMIEFDLKKDTIFEYSSALNIPLSHDRYSEFDQALNVVGSNNHTASKPYIYSEVSRYFDLDAQRESLLKNKSGWWGRKLWNEHMGTISGENYWFTIDPIVDLQLGTSGDDNVDYTYNNTRGLQVQGGLGKGFNFSATVFESQARFADYVNRYARSIAPAGGNPGIIPGRGIAKVFKEDAFDYPVAEGYISYSPTRAFNVQFGHGKNFIGDGYRSLLQSDVASPYPYLKLNTQFWKIRYTNTWMSLRDVRPAAVDSTGAFQTKYMANHYLSWNVSKRLNLGLFEAVMWKNDNGRGFDVNYLNPVIFYRAIEFSTGSRAGNAIVGLSSKYKWSDTFNMYGQFILDEFSLNDIKGGNKSWKNKYGYQIGFKYYNAFKVKNLLLQAEYNQVRPYTYSHNTGVLNYGHNNQSMAHLWGANFKEFIGIARYRHDRWYGSAKLIMGQRGFDFNEGGDTFNYGGDIYRSEVDRPSDTGIEIGQGNTTNVFLADLQAGYLVNPTTNLKLFANITYRNFDPEADTATEFQQNTTWFNIGLRTDIFNWYFDF